MTTITELKTQLQALDGLKPTVFTWDEIAAERARIERDLAALEAGQTEANLRRAAIKHKYGAVNTPRSDAAKLLVRVRNG